MMSRQNKAAVGVLALAQVFGSTSAQSAVQIATVYWEPSPTPEICGYRLLYRPLPGYIGQTGTKLLPSIPSQTLTASVPIDYDLTHIFAVQAFGAPTGKTCANTTTFVYSVLSNVIAKGGSFGYYYDQNPLDTDGDYIPDSREAAGGPDMVGGKAYYRTYTDPTKAQTTAGCPMANDGEILSAADSIRPNAWVNLSNPYINGLNNPNHYIFKAACKMVTDRKTVPIP